MIRVAILLALAACWAGCDSGTSKSESQYRALTGTWEVVSLRASGVSYTTEIGTRYDSLQMTFADSTAGRTYDLQGTQDAREILAVSGRVQLLDVESIALTSGLPDPVLLTYDITQSRRATLTVPPGPNTGADGLLETLLPQGSWAESQSVELRLERL
ncbi:hypothetical protein CRI94_03595 [Longibacter salinarum]|uniref:Lipocalin-like domain-containing protein n=1 Tax=Longibacter salinarum TaxID=1850348 RepID=A0A2A8D3A7_9BACT|nr:hypothetical protein CRI94_03595 [Longibacter salinarum]